jgi:hypothetical protein
VAGFGTVGASRVRAVLDLNGLAKYLAEGGGVGAAELSAIASVIASVATLVTAIGALVPYLKRREARSKEEQQQMIELVIEQMQRREGKGQNELGTAPRRRTRSEGTGEGAA